MYRFSLQAVSEYYIDYVSKYWGKISQNSIRNPVLKRRGMNKASSCFTSLSCILLSFCKGNPQPIKPPVPITVFLSRNLFRYFNTVNSTCRVSALLFVSQAAGLCTGIKGLFHLLCSARGSVSFIILLHAFFYCWPLFTHLITKYYQHAKVKTPSSGWQDSLQTCYYLTGSSGSHPLLSAYLNQERAIKLPDAEVLEHLSLWKN